MNITYEQYQLAKALVEQYEEWLRCEEKEDDDYDNSMDEEDREEAEWEERCELAATCKCGAWIFNKNGDVVHVADCCCGAE